MPKPKVSVVVPSYNRADYIPATIDSILAQSFTDFELIFIDDGSTDNTEKIMQRYSDEDSRVKYFKQPNSERAVARSHGMSLALGDYVCLVDSDDIWYQNKLEKQLAVMDEDPETVVCYASVNRIDFDNNKVKAAARQHHGYSGHVFFDLLNRNFIPSVTPMIRKKAIDRVGDQVTEFIPYEDWDFWLRLSREGKFHHISEPLGDYRIHPGQSVQNVKAEKIEEVTLKILDANTKNDHLSKFFDKFSIVELNPNGDRNNHQVKIAEIADNAYSLAYLRAAYWYLIANKPNIARERLNKSRELNKARSFDYRWWGLYIVSYFRSWTGDLVKNFLGAFHNFS